MSIRGLFYIWRQLIMEIMETKVNTTNETESAAHQTGMMDINDFDYDLPEELIAQDPIEDRSSSRLLLLDKKTGKTQDKIFRDIIDELNPGDCLVINNTKVIPARLMGVKEDTGAHIEVLLLKREQDDVWEVLVKPGKKAKPGTIIIFGDGRLKAEVLEVVEDGNRKIRFSYQGIFEEILDELGQITSHTSLRIRIVIRLFMQSMKAQQQHRQRDFISQRIC